MMQYLWSHSLFVLKRKNVLYILGVEIQKYWEDCWKFIMESNVKIIINFGQYSIPVFDCSSSAFVIFEIVVKLVVVVANVVIVGAVDSVPITN